MCPNNYYLGCDQHNSQKHMHTLLKFFWLNDKGKKKKNDQPRT